MMNRYATVDQALFELDKDKLTEAADDTKKFLWHALGFVSERIEQMTAMEFAPRIDTHYFDARGDHLLSSTTIDVVAGQVGDLRSPLLAITSITLGGDSAALDASAYQAHPRGVTPIRRVVLIDGSDWYNYDTTYHDAHTIVGVWGYHQNYNGAWVSSGDTVQNTPLSASGTSVTVTNTAATVGWGLPRFSAGMLLRFGTGYDYRTLDYVNNATTLTVTPNANGSTSTEQPQGTAIYIWQPEVVIQRAALKWAQHLFARRGVTTASTFDAPSGVVTNYPPDAPQEVTNILQQAGFLQNAYGWRAV